MNTVRIVSFVLLSLGISLIANAREPRPVTLYFAESLPWLTPKYGASGWPLELTMYVRESLLGFENAQRPFYPSQPGAPPLTSPSPLLNQRITFDDPDGCQSLGTLPQPPCPGFGAPQPPTDELNLSFAAGVTVPEGNPALVEEEVGPTLPGLNILGTSRPYLGPFLGSTGDGYGFGASIRMPGLVIVSDTGVGIVNNANFDRPATRQCRNLAGFLTSVSVVLNNGINRTRLNVHMNVPEELFSPIVLRDDDVNGTGACPADQSLVRVEGRPAQCRTNEQIALIYDRHKVTVTAFVVSLDDIGNITPPDTVTDLNGNGRCDAGDLKLAGYRVLSNSARHRFRQLHQNEIWDAGYEYRYDLDGNGSTGSLVNARLALFTPSLGGGRVRAPR